MITRGLSSRSLRLLAGKGFRGSRSRHSRRRGAFALAPRGMDEALGLRADGLPSGGALLVTDEVAASGGWLVAHFLRVRFPTVLVLNKMDAEGARAHADAIKRRFPREPTAETVATTREGTRA